MLRCCLSSSCSWLIDRFAPLLPLQLLPAKNRVFSEAELALHDGLHPPIPIYLAIDGDVFDVSAGAAYAPGGSYAHFAGKDAARAYVTGCFKTHLTHDIRGFGEKELNVSYSHSPMLSRK